MLRVIGGEAKGRKLNILKGMSVRPTGDKVKGALFNILREEIAGAEVLDLFAGAGNLGLEALSRGAKRVVFVDKRAVCAGIIRKNLARLDFQDRAEVYEEEAVRAVRRLAQRGREVAIVFVDPPYGSDLAEETLGSLAESHLVKDEGIVVVEHYWKRIMPGGVGGLKLVRDERYGDTALSFYEAQTTDQKRNKTTEIRRHGEHREIKNFITTGKHR